jgi:hypothetical protein
MKNDDRTLQLEIIISTATGRRSGPRHVDAPMATEPPPIPRVARLMALAIKFQDMVDRGEVRDYADLARLGYVTRARLTQIMNLMLLAPDIQGEILRLGTEGDEKIVAESQVRVLVKSVLWEHQRRIWRTR